MDRAFAAQLKEYRLAAGLTQEALAERAGLGVRSIQALERGESRPLRDTLRRLMAALAVPEAERTGFLTAGTPAPRGSSTAAGITSTPPRPPAHPHNLPPQLTNFVGRTREIAEITNLLAGTRLLTLTGTGGVGKTRLALAVAGDLLHRYPDGVWLAELASLADPSLVPATVLVAVGVREQPGRSPLEILPDALRTRQMLLVLDNCEHLLDACARLAEVLLRACPGLRILATSREPLGLAGETRWRVPSLSLPTMDQLACPEAITRCEAVRLFLERARAVQPQFVLTPTNAPAVARICARLDGIPLALELAASQVRAIGVADLAARLDQRFRLLTGGSRTALPRQQTLRATVNWGYDLLTEHERLLFARLAVFAGGFTLASAEAVCVGEDLAGEEVLDLLVRLVDKSLVVADEADGEVTRYRLLETLRQYGQERLVSREDAEAVYQRHAAHYLALAEEVEDEATRYRLTGQGQVAWWLAWLSRMESEQDNLRDALRWLLHRGATEESLRFISALARFWEEHSDWDEGFAWLEQALALPGAAQARALPSALVMTGWFALVRSDPTARGLFEEAVLLGRKLDDRWALARALMGLGVLASYQNDFQQARPFLQESLAHYRALGNWLGITWALCDLARLSKVAEKR